MRTGRKILLSALGVCAITLAWGYWHSLTHASINLIVRDYGLKTDKLAYGMPHEVTITFLGPANEPLAIARSVEPQGFIAAVHPRSEIGNCQHRGFNAATGRALPRDDQECFAEYSAWTSQWAPQVRRAHIAVGTCNLRDLPVRIDISNEDWWLW